MMETYKSNGGAEQAVGLNFGNITLPPGIEIASAYIQFTSQEKEMKNTIVPSMDIRAEAVDNSSPFVAQDNNITSRPTSTARVNWRPARWKRPFRDGPNQQSSYLTALIQGIVDRPGWKDGNSIGFIIQRADDEVGGTKYRLAQTDPELVIDYVNKTKPAAVQPAKKVIKSRPADGKSDDPVLLKDSLKGGSGIDRGLYKGNVSVLHYEKVD